MKKALLLGSCLLASCQCFCWGFYAHQMINYYAVFLLPPEMLVLYKPNIRFLSEHAVDPDKRRYAIRQEAPRHYIDMDRYGKFPFSELPAKWEDAVAKYGEDTLQAYGIAPWWIQVMLRRLTTAFKDRNQAAILKLSAEMGHYLADAHVPLHACRNHNGQFTGQKGIHGFWESRVPELLAEKEWDFFLGKAGYIKDPLRFTWERVFESAEAADTVLTVEKALSRSFAPDLKFAFEPRKGITTRQYSAAYTLAYDRKLKGMVQRRMKQSIYAIASFWYTAWVNAGQPDLRQLGGLNLSPQELSDFEQLNQQWKNGSPLGKGCDE